GNADYYQLTADQDKEIHLGSMGDFEYEMPVHEQFLSDGENVYFVLSARDGTAMMLSGSKTGRAVAGEEDSLTVLDQLSEFSMEEGDDRLPELYLDEAGDVRSAFVAPHTPLLGSLEEGGDLMLSYEPDEYSTIIEGFRKEPSGSINEEERYIQQTAEYIDGKIYLIVAQALRTPDEDIGWRESYGLEALEYICVDPESGRDDLLSVVK
ncbi:MAG: hypothetical protein K6B28_06390, partial [Lachnospiraceae bacterium]|nr:hypothetical protein [Lachnospiraceae bacterium]